MSKSKVNKTGFWFSISAVFMNLLIMLTGILSIKWISPADMGVWNSLAILISYIYILQFGVINGLGRELPFFLGNKKNNIAIELAKTSLYIVKTITLFTLIFGISIASYIFINESSKTFYTSISIIFLMIIQFYNNYLLGTFRSSDSFKRLTHIYIIQSILISLTIVLVYKYKYEGHLIRMTLIAAVQLALLHYFRPFKIKAGFNKVISSILIKTGLPLFVLNYLYGIVNTFGRLIILGLGTSLQMGLYTPAIAINSAMKLIPVTLSQYFYPKIAHAAGSGQSSLIIWKYSKKISYTMILITIPIAILGYFLLPILIFKIFPDYQDGLYTAQLSVLAGIFAAGSHIFTTSLSSLKAIKQLAFLNISRAIIFYGIIYMFAINFDLLTGIGYGLIVSEIAFYLLAFFYSKRYFTQLKNVR